MGSDRSRLVCPLADVQCGTSWSAWLGLCAFPGCPSNYLQHCSGTTCASVVVHHKPCGTPLNHLNFLVECGCLCPSCRGYSSVRRTYVLQALSFADCGALLMFLLKKAMVEFAFLTMLSVCFAQDRSLLMVTPRYFASVFIASF